MLNRLGYVLNIYIKGVVLGLVMKSKLLIAVIIVCLWLLSILD